MPFSSLDEVIWPLLPHGRLEVEGMRQSLLERCEAQVRNEAALRKVSKLEFETTMKLCAMLYADAGAEVDPDRIKECKGILKQRAGVLSNFRGNFERVILVKMALASDPAAYIDGVIGVYEKLRSGRKLPGEMLAMASTTIYENCPAGELDEVIEKTLESYAAIKAQHPVLTDDSDMPIIALMVMAGKDPSEAADQAEELFTALRDRFRVGSDAAQTTAMVMALSDKPADQKVEDYVALFEACKAAGHATSKDRAMAIYAAYADLDADLAEIVAEIGEVDEWLKGNKGYGALGVGASMRRLFAATLVLQDRQAGSLAASAGTTSAVAQAVVEQLLLILIMLLIMMIIVSSTVAASH